jgi:hypothetical protein
MVRLTDDGMTPAAEAPTETTMFAKTLVAALVLAGASLTFIADASAKPTQQPQPRAEQGYMADRHSPSDTNGGF